MGNLVEVSSNHLLSENDQKTNNICILIIYLFKSINYLTLQQLIGFQKTGINHGSTSIHSITYTFGSKDENCSFQIQL